MSVATEFTPDHAAQFARGYRTGQAVLLGMSGRINLEDMVQECAQACNVDTFIYARYSLDTEVITFVAHGAKNAQDIAPSHRAMIRLRPGHLQTFGSQGLRYGLLVLGRTAHHLDMIIVSSNAIGALKTMAEYLTDAWHTRKAGVIAAGMANCDNQPTTASILSPSNPCKLTRKETQVCHYLVDGLKPKDLAERMSLSMPTVRTHLRNIYAKTGLDGMVGVVHALHLDNGTSAPVVRE